MNYVFLDTNIFLHCKYFEQLDWPTILNKQKDIVITLTPTVIDELDKHKYNKNSKIAERVKKLLPKIEGFIDNPELCKYSLKHITTRPLDLTFIENHLDKNVQDDCLLASIIQFTQNLEKNDSVVLITNDVGPRLKAKSFKIFAMKLPDQYLLPNERDESEIKISKLQNEINELKNKSPILSLSFANNSNLKKFKRDFFELSKQEFVESEMKKVKSENPHLVYRDLFKNKNPKPSITFSNSNPFLLSESQIIDYNLKVNEYYEDQIKYIESLFDSLVFKLNTIEINLFLNNNGTSPALDIDIEIYFPDGFEILQEKYLPKILPIPSLLYKPKHIYDFNLNSSPFDLSYLGESGAIDFPNSNKLIIKKTNSYLISTSIESLKHNQIFELEKLYVKFDNINVAKGFTIDYKLIVSNITDVVNGKLNVNIG